MKKVNRGWLKRQINNGKMLARKTMSFDPTTDGTQQTGQTEFKPCFISDDVSERRPGQICIWEYDFRSKSGCCYMDNEGLINLSDGGDSYELKMEAELTAHVSQEIANWLDPAGKLQKAGLMKIDVNMPEPSFVVNDREAVRQGKHCNMDKMLNQS